MKIIVEAPAGKARSDLIGKLLTSELSKDATLVFDPRDPHLVQAPSAQSWLICVDPEFADLPVRVRCAANSVYRLEGLNRWRKLRYVS